MTDLPCVHHPCIAPPVDYAVLYALCGIERYPAARLLAKELGPELFPPGPALAIAADLIRERPPAVPAGASDEVRSMWATLREEMSRSTGPNTEDWALYAVRLLAEYRHTNLLAESLVHAAEAVLRHAPLPRVRRDVEHAFDVAQGYNVAVSAALLTGGGR